MSRTPNRVSYVKTSLLAGVAALMLAPASALADGPEMSVEDRLALLEAELMRLKSELAARDARDAAQAAEVEEVKAVASQAAAAAKAGGTGGDGFYVGNTQVKYGGFMDLDVHATSTSDGDVTSAAGRDFYIPATIPTSGDEGGYDVDFTAKASRIYFTTATNLDGAKIGTRVEMDFLLSGQGNERVSNSYSPRLRRAYLTYNNWLFGQEWSTFQALQAIPESASFLVAGDGMIFDRQAMVRYTNGNWQFAVENPNTTVTTAGGRVVADDNAIPDVVARYNHKADGSNISVAALLRNLEYDDGLTGGVDDSLLGWGVMAAGQHNFSGGNFKWQLAGGDGLGRYIGLNTANAAAVDPVTGDLEAITSYGGLAAVQFKTGEASRFNAGYSLLTIDNPDFLDGTGNASMTQSAFANIMWDIAPKVTLGFEVLHGQRENEDDTKGDLTRLTFSAKRAF